MPRSPHSTTPEHSVEAPSLGLPRGGAIRGLGETFSPDEFSGAANLSVPIPLMPCRGFEPALALNYSSGSGNGPFGLGFALSLPSIARATNKGTPRYDGDDHFVIQGNDYLVPLDGEARNSTLTTEGEDMEFHVQRYAPRRVGDFALIEFWQSKHDDHRSFWKVTGEDHVIRIFGWSAAARVANPDAPGQVFRWLLEESYDVSGNHQLYEYLEENTENVDTLAVYEHNRVVGAQRYPARIRYGNDRPIADSILLNDRTDEPGWHFEVVFNYGQYTLPPANMQPCAPTGDWACRPDPFSTYAAGFEVRTYRRCESILCFSSFAELGAEPVLVAALRLRYADVSEANGFLSQIAGITETGYTMGGPRSRGRAAAPQAFEELSYPELEFGYTIFQPAGRDFARLDATNGNLNGLEGDGYSLVDLYGQGIPGVLYADGRSVLYREPELRRDPDDADDATRHSFAARAALKHEPYQMRYGDWRVPEQFPIPRLVDGAGIGLSDHTGDGRMDLQWQEPGHNGYWQARANRTWTDFHAFDRYPADEPAPNQTAINAAGAGLADLFQIRDDRNYVYPNARAAGYDPAVFAEREATMPSTLESGETVQLQFADMAGSGTPQFVKVEANRVRYWPNLSFGRFAKPVEMAKAPDFHSEEFSVGFRTDRLFLADVDGSGTADLIYVDARAVYVYLNKSGNEFADAIRMELPHTFDALDQIAFADIYGQGTTCMVLSYPHGLPNGGDLGPVHLVYDFCGRSKPYLLNRSANNLGGETEITYAGSVDYYLRDQRDGRPWLTGLPFPVQVVARSTVRDRLTGSYYTSLYAYHDGYYDGTEREFQGFGRVDRQDSEYLPPGARDDHDDGRYVAPALRRTWYDVGCFEEHAALLEQYRSEYYQGDDAALPLPENAIDCDDPDSLPQAYAALAGNVLRTEVYGLDDAGEADGVPYTVECSGYTVRTIQAQGEHRYGVFFVHGREDQSYAYDRNPLDPRVEQQFTLQVDAYGNVERSAAVSYPRRQPLERLESLKRNSSDAAPIEETTLAQQEQWRVFCSTTAYINHAEPAKYQPGVPYESRSYYLPEAKPAGAGFTFADIAKQVDDALATLSAQEPSSDRVVLESWGRSIFAKVDARGETRALPPGEVQLPALLYQQQGAVDSSANIAAVYAGALSLTELQEKLTQGFFRYDEATDFWWNDGARATYLGADHFYLLASTIAPATDPDDPARTTLSLTQYEYDRYDLLMTAVTDAYGNRARIEGVDYRTMQPDRLIDANETTTEVLLDPLGQVVYTSVYGYENGEPAGFDSVDAAPAERPADAAAVIADPGKYLGRMQSYYYYDFRAYVDRRQPVGALSLTAINYPDAPKTARIAPGLSPGAKLPPIEVSVSYADGLGRELQSKARMEPGDAFLYNRNDGTLSQGHADERWLTSGRTFYNNKGEPIKQYEPYFIDTPECVTNATLDTQGYSATLFYDPIGRHVKTLTPKGFIEKSECSPWHTTAWDANDSIKESPYYRDNIASPPADGETGGPYYDPALSDAARANLEYVAKYCADTPATSLVDNLGNDIVVQRINQYPADLDHPMAGEPVREELYDYMQYDESGRQLRSSDPRLSANGIFNFTLSYVMSGDAPLKTVSADSGTSWVLPNAFGNPVFSCHSRGVAMRTEYDLLQRPVASRAKQTASGDLASSAEDPLVIDQVVGRVVYGDSPNSGAPEKCNLIGRPFETFDPAGLVTTPSYGLGGRPLTGDRRFFRDYKTQGNWDDASPAAQECLLQNERFSNSAVVDALGRTIESADTDGNVSLPVYHIGGALDTLSVTTADDDVTAQYVDGISYNALGQRLSMRAGNGMITEYFYDPRTHATLRTRTINAKHQTLQDIAYEYDPVGNVFRKETRSDAPIFHKQEKVQPVSTYMFDALYQLIQANGREKIGNGRDQQQKHREPDLPSNIPHTNDLTALCNFIERYSYDRGGNRTRTEHRTADRQWTRDMVVSNRSNRAVSSRINGDRKFPAPTPEQVDDFFDAHGNQVILRTAHPLVWNFANQLQSVTIVERQDHTEKSAAGNDVEYYVYDGGGQRVRKINETYGFGGTVVTVRETLYSGNIEIRRTSRGPTTDSAAVSTSSVISEYHSLRIMDDENGVATRDLWTAGDPPGDFLNPAIIYHLQDNLNSYTTQVNADGEIIAREEYAPFGESTFFAGVGGADELTHYRYSGQERDNATGFYYYGARYYANWLGRWLSPDPAGTIDGPNLYAFVGNNPVSMVDVGGMGQDEPVLLKKQPKPPPESESEIEEESGDESFSEQMPIKQPKNQAEKIDIDIEEEEIVKVTRFKVNTGKAHLHDGDLPSRSGGGFGVPKSNRSFEETPRVPIENIEAMANAIIQTTTSMTGDDWSIEQKQEVATELNFIVDYETSRPIGTHAIRAGADIVAHWHPPNKKDGKGRVAYEYMKDDKPGELLKKLDLCFPDRDDRDTASAFLMLLIFDKIEVPVLLERYDDAAVAWLYKFATIQFAEQARENRAIDLGNHHLDFNQLGEALKAIAMYGFQVVYGAQKPGVSYLGAGSGGSEKLRKFHSKK